MTLGKKIFIVGMGLGCFASRKLLMGVFVLLFVCFPGGTNTGPIKVNGAVCQQMRTQHTKHQVSKELSKYSRVTS